MEFDAANPDVPVSEEHLADYWRARAECLEEWICELLRKNQALRMDLDDDGPCPRKDCAEIRSGG